MTKLQRVAVKVFLLCAPAVFLLLETAPRGWMPRGY
jgi:hypothetical protein